VRVLELMPLALTLLAAVGYCLAWCRLSRRGHRWPARRAACMLGLYQVAERDSVIHAAVHLLCSWRAAC